MPGYFHPANFRDTESWSWNRNPDWLIVDPVEFDSDSPEFEVSFGADITFNADNEEFSANIYFPFKVEFDDGQPEFELTFGGTIEFDDSASEFETTILNGSVLNGNFNADDVVFECTISIPAIIDTTLDFYPETFESSIFMGITTAVEFEDPASEFELTIYPYWPLDITIDDVQPSINAILYSKSRYSSMILEYTR